jgi:hypothetical protein
MTWHVNSIPSYWRDSTSEMGHIQGEQEGASQDHPRTSTRVYGRSIGGFSVQCMLRFCCIREAVAVPMARRGVSGVCRESRVVQNDKRGIHPRSHARRDSFRSLRICLLRAPLGPSHHHGPCPFTVPANLVATRSHSTSYSLCTGVSLCYSSTHALSLPCLLAIQAKP